MSDFTVDVVGTSSHQQLPGFLLKTLTRSLLCVLATYLSLVIATQIYGTAAHSEPKSLRLTAKSWWSPAYSYRLSHLPLKFYSGVLKSSPQSKIGFSRIASLWQCNRLPLTSRMANEYQLLRIQWSGVDNVMLGWIGGMTNTFAACSKSWMSAKSLASVRAEDHRFVLGFGTYGSSSFVND